MILNVLNVQSYILKTDIKYINRNMWQENIKSSYNLS